VKSVGVWLWCVIICEKCFFLLSLSFVYTSVKLRFGSWIFHRLGPPVEAIHARDSFNQEAQRLGFLFLFIFTWRRKRSSFRNVVIILKYRRSQSLKKHFYRSHERIILNMMVISSRHYVMENRN
jgi:hypothetical protein